MSLVSAGSPATRQAAMEGGRASNGACSPSTFIAQKKGFNLLADVAAPGYYQHTGVATTQKFIKENPRSSAYVKSQVEAVHRLKTDRESGIRVLAKYMGGIKDRDILEKVTTLPLPIACCRKQYPTLEGIKTIWISWRRKMHGRKGEP
jgi:hypothetical protein